MKVAHLNIYNRTKLDDYPPVWAGDKNWVMAFAVPEASSTKQKWSKPTRKEQQAGRALIFILAVNGCLERKSHVSLVRDGYW